MSTREMPPGNEAETATLSPEHRLAPPEPNPAADEPTRQEEQPKQAVSDYRRGDPLDRYVVLELLGRGGMGAVYAAYDPKLDRRVAVKLLRSSRQNPQKRLVREAKALAKLSHPNVVQVHDAGVHQGNVFIAMELVAGVSLKGWVQSEPRPAWQEVLATYLDAARGLAAAHQNGLVHRDVKPSNLLRGNDGRVRVADFGLAAAAQRGEDTSGDSQEEASTLDDSTQSSLPGSLEERLTVTGSIMGTPAYMAPEQHLSADVGPAADQYSLCASLYEALYEQLPFAAKSGRASLAELLSKKLSAEVLPPPPGSPVPAWVFQALRRGLSATPADRYPSIDELIAALAHDPGARRRSRMRIAALGSMTLVLITLALWGWARSGVFDDSCTPKEQRRFLAGSWDQAARARIETAFLATGKAYAADTAKRVSAILDAYAGAWVSMRAEVCRAHGQEDSEAERELLKLRTLCLERRRGQLQAIVEVLGAAADDTVLSKAVTAAQGLYPLSYCADQRALTARLPPPEDPVLRAKVEALQPRVDRLEALHEAGKYHEGLEEAERMHAEVAGLGHVPLRAEAMFWLTSMQTHTGNYDSARVHVQEAMFLASQAADDILAARAWGLLLYITGERQKRMEELKLFVDGVSAVVDDTRDDRARATLMYYLATSLGLLGRLENAKATQERALAIREQVLGPEHPEVAISLNNLANIFYELGKYGEAKALHERALAIREKALGPEHPEVAISLNNLANALSQMGKLTEAKTIHERTLAIREKALGPEHPEVAFSLSNLANALSRIGKYKEARIIQERAVALQVKTLGPEHPDVAFFLSNLATIFKELGKYKEAKEIFEQALVILEKMLDPEHRDIGIVTQNLAQMLRETGEHAQAKAMFERTLGIWEKALGPEHPYLMYPLVGIGRMIIAGDWQGGSMELGQRYLERAKAIGDKALEPQSPLWAEMFLSLGELALARQQPQEAVAVLERALAIHNLEYRTDIELALAEALWRTAGNDTQSRHGASDVRARAVTLARQARDHCREIGHQPNLARAERWLADHPLP